MIDQLFANIDISVLVMSQMSLTNDGYGTSYLMRYGSLYFNLENCHNYIEIKMLVIVVD